MKLNSRRHLSILLAALGLACTSSSVLGEDAPASDSPGAPPIGSTAAPLLGYGATQILQLSKAGVADDTIVAYIRNSGNSYLLSAEQVIYLQQQGLSTPVINTMLSQPKTTDLASVPAARAAPGADASAQIEVQPSSDPQADLPYVMVGPAVTAIDPSAAAAAAYYPHYGYPSYAYPHPFYRSAYGYSGYHPAVSVWIGVGGSGGHGGACRGGGFHGGGFRGGFHR